MRRWVFVPCLCLAGQAAAQVGAAQTDAFENKMIEFPHPVISEVLFNTPRGGEGDASQDGKRSAIGDEFIELVNPHDRPIELGGYTVMDRGANVSFALPEMTLEPGGVVVIFNGYETEIAGPIGGAETAIPEPNEHFHGALVFNMGNASRTAALSNQTDMVMLAAPDDTPIDLIEWGRRDMRAYASQPRRVFVTDNPNGSVQRTEGGLGPIKPHGEIDGAAFSPGKVPGGE